MQVTINKNTNQGTFWIRDASFYLANGDSQA